MSQTAIEDPMLDEVWLAAPQKRSRLRAVLAALLVASLCFLGGAIVQKQFGAVSETTGATALPSGGLSAGGLPEGIPEQFQEGAAGLPGATEGDAGDGATAETDSQSVIGKVIAIRRDTWVVEDLGGQRHQIVVNDDTALIRETGITPDQVDVGDGVDVSGATTKGRLQASEVTLR